MTPLSKEILDSVEMSSLEPVASTIDIVLNFIEFVKNIERARGLSDDEIVAKYTYGGCEMLSQSLKSLVDRLNSLGINEERMNATIDNMDVHIPNGRQGEEYHSYLELYKLEHQQNQKSIRPGGLSIGMHKTVYGYIDIFGCHDYSELEYYRSKFWTENDYYGTIAHSMPTEERNYDVPLIAIDYYLQRLLVERNTKGK